MLAKEEEQNVHNYIVQSIFLFLIFVVTLRH